MLRIEADGLTLEDIADLRERHSIVDKPGFVTVLSARKVGEQIVWSIERMKEGYWRTLQTESKTTEVSQPVTA